MSDPRPSGIPVPLAGKELFRTSQLDEAREHVSRVFQPHRLDLISGHGFLDARQNGAILDKVGLTYLSYGGRVRITPGVQETFFMVQIPLAGRAEISQGHVEILSTASRASVLGVDEPIEMVWHENTPQLTVRIERGAVESHLSAMTGEPVDRPVRFSLGMELSRPGARSWMRMVRMLQEELEESGPLIGDKRISRELEGLLIRGLLLAHSSNYSKRLGVDIAPAYPKVVREAIEYIHASLSTPIAMEDLARHCGVGLRALQRGFRRHLDTTPSAYLQELRLDRVHRDLSAASHADGTTVTEVSLRWGFRHPGRFAGSYRRRFGERPIDTLRSKVA